MDSLIGFEDAIIGNKIIDGKKVLLYSENKMIDIVMNDKDLECDNYSEALDYISYGIERFEDYYNFVIVRDNEELV